MTAPPFSTSRLLETDGVSHGFFSRVGGVSQGPFASLNTGFGSGDIAGDVAENRRRCAHVFSIEPDRLLTPHQTHSPNVAAVDAAWSAAPARADAIVTRTPGIAIGVLAADCMPFLLLEPEAKVIGAAHAGWRGALAGVVENTVAAMEDLGAQRANIKAALGPCLRQPNFEVGLDLLTAFTAIHPESARFFSPGKSDEKRQLDLAGFGAWRLQQAGVVQFDDLEQCTLAAPDRYFSFRGAKREGESDYGRNLSAIMLD